MGLHATMGRLRHSVGTILRAPAPTLDPFEAYQLWAARYDDTGDNALLYAEERHLRPWFEPEKLLSKDLLDAGCGTGRYLRGLQEFHPRSITLMDFSPNMIGHARSKINGSVPVSLHIARVERLPFKNGSFDFILCTLVLGHVRNLSAAIEQLSRVLRRGGTIVISCFHPFGHLLGWKRTFHADDGVMAVDFHRHLHSDYLGAFLKNGLELTRVEEPIIDESVRHFYERAGRSDIYARYVGYPMLLLFEVRKK